MKEYIPYIFPALSAIGFWVKLLLDEKRTRRKEEAERLKELQELQQNETSALPPRKVTHSKR